MSASAPTRQIDVGRFTNEIDKLAAMARSMSQGASPEVRAQLESVLADVDRVPQSPTLVVVGETKKGKSSLVNALLGRPLLSPVDADVATCTYLLFEHGPEAAYVMPETDRGADDLIPRKQIPIDELWRWTTVTGVADNPHAQRVIDGHSLPAPYPVEVTLPVPILEDLALIDTPGTGGLVGEHAVVTRTAVRLATAMLFVTEITSPLTTGELEFLDQVADQVGEVIIAVNMADKLDATTRDEAMRDLRQKIVDRIPRYESCALVPVSAKRAESALTVESETVRTQLRALSGLDDLAKTIQQVVVQRGAIVGQVMRARRVRDMANMVVAAQKARLDALDPGTPQKTATDLQQELQDLNYRSQTMQAEIGQDLATLQTTLMEYVDTATRKLRVTIDAEATKGRKASELSPMLDAALDGIGREVVQLTANGVHASIQQRLGATLDDPVFAAAQTKALAEVSAVIARRDSAEFESIGLTTEMLLSSSVSGYSGMTIGNTLGDFLSEHGIRTLGIAGVAVATAPFALIGVAGMIMFQLRTRRRAMETQQVRSWVREANDQAVRDLQNAVSLRLRTASFLVNSAMRDWQKLAGESIREEALLLQASAREREELERVTRSTQASAMTLIGAATKLIDAAAFHG